MDSPIKNIFLWNGILWSNYATLCVVLFSDMKLIANVLKSHTSVHNKATFKCFIDIYLDNNTINCCLAKDVLKHALVRYA